MKLKEETWAAGGRISEEEKAELAKPFTMQEIESSLAEMRKNTAPGPDGFSVQFYKEFWPKVKGLVKEMLDDLHADKLNLGRLNYGVITLIPKIKDANVIKQYRPICLLNVIFKIVTRVLMCRLSKVADKVVH